MSAVTEHTDHGTEAHDHADHGSHPTTLTFVKVAIILAVITALETSTYWWVEDAHTVAMITLFVCMAIKFVMILLWFMHLKWDSALFSLMFYIGVGLAIAVYIVALMTFHFFA